MSKHGNSIFTSKPLPKGLITRKLLLPCIYVFIHLLTETSDAVSFCLKSSSSKVFLSRVVILRSWKDVRILHMCWMPMNELCDRMFLLVLYTPYSKASTLSSLHYSISIPEYLCCLLRFHPSFLEVNK